MSRSLTGSGRKIYRGVSIFSLLILTLILLGCRQIRDNTQNAFAEPGPRIYGDHAVGQTFLARHDNLTRVDVLLATYTRLQLHPVVFVLKESPTSADELIRVTSGPLTIQDNTFHTFSFAPIPNSAGHSYYFEIQSPAAPGERPVTVWYQPSDVYADGEGYQDGQPMADADVAFRTYYDPGSLGKTLDYLRSRLPDAKPGIWGEQLFYDALFALYGVLIVVFFLALLRLAWRPVSENPASRVERALWSGRRWLLPLLLALAMVRGIIYASVTYPWQVPDEHGHYEYARLMAERKRVPLPKDMSLSLQREILASMYAYDFWRLAGRATPGEPPPYFTADSYLQYSRPQIGDEPPLYYLLPAVSYLFTRNQSVEFQLYVMRITSVIFLVMTVWFCYLMAQEVFGERRPLSVMAISALVVFLPMFAYIGTGVNNDVAAAAAASWVFYLLARLYRRGVTSYRALWLFIVLGLALLVKKTNLFLVPTVFLAAIVCVRPRLKPSLSFRHLVYSVATLTGIMLLLQAVLSRVPTGDVWAWQERPRPWMQTQDKAHSRTGDASFYLKDDSVDWVRKLVQTIPPYRMSRIAGRPVTFSAWVWGEAEGQPGTLAIRDSETEAATSFTAGPNWTHVSVSHIIDPRAISVDLILVAGNDTPESLSDLYFDDLTLFTDSANTTEANNMLRNGSAEISQNLIQALPEYTRVYFGVPVNMGNRLLDSRYYTFSQLVFYALSVRYAFNSFWARFAQQALVVARGWYYLWGIMTLLALAGTGVRLARSRLSGADRTFQSNALLVMGSALLLITIQTFLPMMRLEHSWMPQGRYVFPAIVPISIFLVLGIGQISPVRLRNVSALAVVVMVSLFDLVCLFNYIIPYFYG